MEDKNEMILANTSIVLVVCHTLFSEAWKAQEVCPGQSKYRDKI
jgi:hypothetical protein